jgi:hypothetical protein
VDLACAGDLLPGHPRHRGDEPSVSVVVGERRESGRVEERRADADEAGAPVGRGLRQRPPGDGELQAQSGQLPTDPRRRLDLAAGELRNDPDARCDGAEQFRRDIGCPAVGPEQEELLLDAERGGRTPRRTAATGRPPAPAGR